MTDNRLLKRQLKKAGITDIKQLNQENFKLFLAQIEQSYDDTNNDRYILERSIEISSLEMHQLNQNLEKRVQEEVAKNSEKEQRLFQQTRLAQMGELLSMIAHQWRQPLSTIGVTAMGIGLKIKMGKYDLTNEDDRETFKVYLEKKLTQIDSYVQYLSTTIDDFRNFFSEKKIEEEININELIDKSLTLLEGGFIKHNVQVEKNFQSVPKIVSLPNELLQVFLNIFKNALDNFRDKDISSRLITITSREENNFIIITIKDNGGGIPKNIIDKIFDPYFSTKSDKNGTGLGLYMSKTIIHEHCQGELSVHNKEDSACFTITLPLKFPNI